MLLRYSILILLFQFCGAVVFAQQDLPEDYLFRREGVSF